MKLDSGFAKVNHLAVSDREVVFPLTANITAVASQIHELPGVAVVNDFRMLARNTLVQ